MSVSVSRKGTSLKTATGGTTTAMRKNLRSAITANRTARDPRQIKGFRVSEAQIALDLSLLGAFLRRRHNVIMEEAISLLLDKYENELDGIKRVAEIISGEPEKADETE